MNAAPFKLGEKDRNFTYFSQSYHGTFTDLSLFLDKCILQ